MIERRDCRLPAHGAGWMNGGHHTIFLIKQSYVTSLVLPSVKVSGRVSAGQSVRQVNVPVLLRIPQHQLDVRDECGDNRETRYLISYYYFRPPSLLPAFDKSRMRFFFSN